MNEMKRITIDVPADVKERLAAWAATAKRPLKLHIEWLVETVLDEHDGKH